MEDWLNGVNGTSLSIWLTAVRTQHQTDIPYISSFQFLVASILQNVNHIELKPTGYFTEKVTHAKSLCNYNKRAQNC